MNALKMTSAGGILLAGTLAFGQSAFAAVCPDSQTLAAFIAAECSIDDKLFQGLASSTADGTNTEVEISVINTPTFGDVYEISFNAIDPVTGPATALIDYVVSIDTSIAPDATFDQFALGVDVQGFLDDVTVDLTLDDSAANLGNGALGVLSSVSGSSEGPLVIIGDNTALYARNNIAVGDEGSVESITNAFNQKVPEPGSIALLGLGIAGMGFFRRRAA